MHLLFVILLLLVSCTSVPTEGKKVLNTDVNKDSSLTQHYAVKSYLIGKRPTQAISADLNGDGYTDVAVSLKEALLVVLLNDTKGDFREPVKYNTITHNTSLAAADIDNDGDIDLIPLTEAVFGPVFLNDGKGAFTKREDMTWKALQFSWSVEQADLNNDGRIDFVITSLTHPKIMTVMNQGNLKFETNTIDLTFEDTGDKGIRQQRRNALRAGKLNQGIRQVALVDINGDGHTDIIAPHYLDQLISIGINDGRGSFTFNRLFLDPTDKETIYYLTSLTLLNYADRKVPDLAIANEYYGIISVFTIQEGTLRLKEKIDTGNLSLLRIASDDMNNDGLPDLACTFTPSRPKGGKSAVQIWVNNGSHFSLSESMTSEGFSAYLNTFRSRQGELPAMALSNIHEGTLTVLKPIQKE